MKKSLILLSTLANALCAYEAPFESSTFLAQHLPLNQNGKISIPEQIKHVKIDIGLSWCAPMSQVWLNQEEDLMVFGFEPNPTAIQSILSGSLIPNWWIQTYFGNDHPLLTKSIIPELIGTRFYIIPCAVGISAPCLTELYITENDMGCSSLFVPVNIPVAGKITVPLIRLSDFFEVFPFETHPKIDYIKIDAQGADLDIVKGASKYLEDHVVCVTIEPENDQYVATDNSASEIESYMISHGFVRYHSINTSDPTYVNTKFIVDFLENAELHIFQR